MNDVTQPYVQDQSSKLRIVVAASEAAPFSKTGGLADVTPALCKALSKEGHDVTMIVPYHRQTQAVARKACPDIHEAGLTFSVPVGEQMVSATVYWSTLQNSQVRVILIDQPDYFDRPGLYQIDGQDFEDNCERFVFFSRAVMECCRRLVIRPHIMHVNDWQTSLIPSLLEIEGRRYPEFADTASVLTIHNLAFQGIFDHSLMPVTGLDWQYFNWRQMEVRGRLNLLKTGIAFANRLTTVSPTYADEIQHPESGCGLDGALQYRANDLTGILNGIDPDVWSPATDPHLVTNYDIENFEHGKAESKAYVQQRMGLPVRPDVPLCGIISRMTDQKGFDLIAEAADRMLEHDIQLAILGTGEPRYETMFQDLTLRYPGKVAANIGFNERLAHQIEAGADIFLMPSRFEPCGLNQMYSLAYGTFPLVRAVGGLADSVVDAHPETIADGSATGISFYDYSSDEFYRAFERALVVYHNPAIRREVIRSGMSQDFSWKRSAQHYISVYRDALDEVRQRGQHYEADFAANSNNITAESR